MTKEKNNEQQLQHKMTKEFLYNFINKYSLTVLGTTDENNLAQTALVGFIVTPDLKIFFDTVKTSRKFKNLTQNQNISFVFGWDCEQTVQYEGKARLPDQSELDSLLQKYFEIFPDGQDRNANWKDIAYFVVDPKWIRHSDFKEPVKIEEINFDK
jgi:general stress protein 26